MAMPRWTRPFTYTIGALTLVSCTWSILDNGRYADGPWANAQWLGQDVVTLVLALPLLLLAQSRGWTAGDRRWQLVHAGVLFYFAYTYAFFMFAAKLTLFFAFHLPIFGLATIGLVRASIALFSAPGPVHDERRGLHWLIAAYLGFIGLMIAGIWLVDLVAHWTDPGHRSQTPDGEAPLIIYALDLGLVIPLMLAAAGGLVRRTRSGFLLAGIILTKTSTLGFALMAMGLSMYVNELDPEPGLAVIWCVIGLLGSVLTVAYLRGLWTEGPVRSA